MHRNRSIRAIDCELPIAPTVGSAHVGNSAHDTLVEVATGRTLAETLGSGTTTGEWGAVPAGDIVITALLYDSVVPVVTEYGHALAGKIVVDISNPFNATADGLAHTTQTSIAADAAKVAPAGTHVIKAFNTIFRAVLENGRPDVFFAGDDAEAKRTFAVFVESLGLRPLDVGGLAIAHWLEGAGVVTMGLAAHGVRHWDFALGVDEYLVKHPCVY